MPAQLCYLQPARHRIKWPPSLSHHCSQDHQNINPSPPSPSSPMPGVRSLGQKETMNGNPGTAKPASIVNSPGAVISRSQSSLVEAFNKILNSKNPLPNYQPDLSIPPPPEWGLRVPSTGYRCLECGDAFALERRPGEGTTIGAL